MDGTFASGVALTINADLFSPVARRKDFTPKANGA